MVYRWLMPKLGAPQLKIAGRRETTFADRREKQLKIDAYGETTFAGRREKQSQMGRGRLAEMRLTSRQINE